jgi:hypothetical protein
MKLRSRGEQLAKPSRGHDLAKAFNYILKLWASFTLFLEDGRVCLSNNAAERGLRGIALGRKSWLFCGSDRGGRRAAAMYSPIVTAKMNGVDKRGSPMFWPASPLIQLIGWTSFCPGLDASISDLRSSGMTTHINKVHHVTIITRVAKDLGEDEDWLWDVASQMEIEDGAIWVYGVGEDGVLVFTDFGIERLIELIQIYKENPELLKRWPPG